MKRMVWTQILLVFGLFVVLSCGPLSSTGGELETRVAELETQLADAEAAKPPVAVATEPGVVPLPSHTPTDTPVPTPTNTPTHTPLPTPTVAPQRFAGQGQQVSPMFELRAGLTMFRMTHDGQSNFAVWLLDGRGGNVDLLANEIGPFDGAKALGIRQPGIHLLNTKGDGNWVILVQQPGIPGNAPRPPQTFRGSGQRVSPVFSLGSGLVTFRMTHDGQSNFAVWLLDGRGDNVDLLANEIGPFDGAKALGVRQPGIHLLNIKGDGNWTVSLEQ